MADSRYRMSKGEKAGKFEGVKGERDCGFRIANRQLPNEDCGIITCNLYKATGSFGNIRFDCNSRPARPLTSFRRNLCTKTAGR